MRSCREELDLERVRYSVGQEISGERKCRRVRACVRSASASSTSRSARLPVQSDVFDIENCTVWHGESSTLRREV